MALKLLPEDLSDVPPHLADRYEAQAGRYWDLFYRRNTTKFFKDRHYLHKEFPALAAGAATLLEVGCGVGNTVFPLLETNPQLRIYCCDFAASAIDFVRQNPAYGTSGGAVHAFVADITSNLLAAPPEAGGCGVPEGGCDLATMIFVLSAIHPQRMAAAVHNVAACLRPGTGRLLFRDYAEGDLAQERLSGGDRPKRLGANFYVRGDGTRCFYFGQSEVLALFASAGFQCDSITLHERTVVNHKRDIAMDRRWLQAIFTLRQPQPPPLPLRTLLAQPPPQHTPHHNYPPQPWKQHQQQACGDGGGGNRPSSEPPGDGGGMEVDTEGPHPPPAQGASAAVASAQDEEWQEQRWRDMQQQQQQGEGRGGAGRGGGGGPGSLSAGAEAVVAEPSPLPGLMLGGGWLTGAAGRLASHLAAGPGHPSGRALLPDSLEAADDLRAELSPSPNTHQQQHQQQQQQHNLHLNHLHPQHPQHLGGHPACNSSGGGGGGTQDRPGPLGGGGFCGGSDGVGGSGGGGGGEDMQVDPPAAGAAAGCTAGADGSRGHGGGSGMDPSLCSAARARKSTAGGGGRSLEDELEAEFFATIGRDSAEVVAEEVAAAGAALSRVRLADVAEVAAARLAAASVSCSTASTAAPAAGAATAAGQAQSLVGRQGQQWQQQQQHQQAAAAAVEEEVVRVEEEVVEVALTAGVSFRVLCGVRRSAAPSSAGSTTAVPAASLALAHLFLASPRLMAGRCAVQLGPGCSAAGGSGTGASSSTSSSSSSTAAAAAVLPAMAAVRSSARRVVVSDPSREGLTAAAADLRRNAPRLVIERVRMSMLDWAAAAGTTATTTTAATSAAGSGSAVAAVAAAATAATGAAGYTYVSGAVRQLRDILQMQPAGYDIVYAADPLAELTSAAAAAAAASASSCCTAGVGAGEAAIAAARGLFEVASQLLLCPATNGGPAGKQSCVGSTAAAAWDAGGVAATLPAQNITTAGRLLLLCFPGAWAAAHGMGFTALAAVCGWELLVPEQLAELYGIDVSAAAAYGCTAMGFRRCKFQQQGLLGQH